jgi:hypothetical protein
MHIKLPYIADYSTLPMHSIPPFFMWKKLLFLSILLFKGSNLIQKLYINNFLIIIQAFEIYAIIIKIWVIDVIV